MKFYIELEDQRYFFLKEWLEKDYQYTANIDDADIVILGINSKVKKCLNHQKVISYHPIKNAYALSQSEQFLKKNAYLTALGCLKQLDITNKKIVIFGNGRIATCLKELLNHQCTLICRHPKVDEEYMDSLSYLDADILINTIPYRLTLDLDKMNKNMKIVDLASFPYGIDRQALKQQGFDIDLWSKIPSKLFGKEAAMLMYEEVIQCLKD